MSRYRIRARRLPDGHFITVTGRDADTLEKLVAAGEKGLTPIEYPAPRWSHYIWKLRGLFGEAIIETIDEPHEGPFAGTHARYVLRAKMEIEACTNEQAAA